MKTAICTGCGAERLVKAPREPIESYIKRRPYCVKCGHKNRIKTLGGHGPTWNGGEFITDRGYVRIWVGADYVFKHRYVYEQAYGKIPDGYVIHHKDHNKMNNSIENLECLSKKDHDEHHRIAQTGKPKPRKVKL